MLFRFEENLTQIEVRYTKRCLASGHYYSFLLEADSISIIPRPIHSTTEIVTAFLEDSVPLQSTIMPMRVDCFVDFD